MVEILEAFEEWAEEEAKKHRKDGWDAHQRGESIKEAIHIGREWAFMLTVSKIREIMENLERSIPNAAQ